MWRCECVARVKGVAYVRVCAAHNTPCCAGRDQYILFLDDDVLLHPGSILNLVRELADDPDVFCSAGFPFDITRIDSVRRVCVYACMRVCVSLSRRR